MLAREFRPDGLESVLPPFWSMSCFGLSGELGVVVIMLLSAGYVKAFC